MFAKLKHWYLIIILGIMILMYLNLNRRIDDFEDKLDLAAGTTSLQMYDDLETYSDSFSIPKHIAYNVAYLETHYQGPFDFNYNPYQTSSAGATGPLQIIPKYAYKFAGRKVSPKELKTNITLNIKISMQMLRAWYNIYHDWTLAAGAYNTGQPIRNDYALYVSSNKDYKEKWIEFMNKIQYVLPSWQQ
jgi:soluble lytic murein transglycosylase-like protein